MFNGFTQETADFLWGITFNNEKPWFEAHREEFNRVLMEPFKALAGDTFGLMCRRWPDMGLKLHVSRIYRDARRLHGRGPYKDHLWFSVKNWDGLLYGPMFWFEIGAAAYSYGMGFYSASAAQMKAFRAAVDAGPARLERLARRLSRQKEFYLAGEFYKRPKGDKGKLLDPWYNRKHLGLECEKDFGGELFSDTLPQTLADAYAFLMPYYEYFMSVFQPETEENE